MDLERFIDYLHFGEPASADSFFAFLPVRDKKNVRLTSCSIENVVSDYLIAKTTYVIP
jgi:hypothetical protein